MKRIIVILIVFSSLASMSMYAQGTGKNSSRETKNALLPDKCYIKYIYEFPFESRPVFYSERFPDLETRYYNNKDLVEPMFRKILKEGYQVSDPNWWGSIKELVNYGSLPAIDTGQILKYLHAGLDTTFAIDENNTIIPFPIYKYPVYSDISGLFFFESWHLNPRKGFLIKEVVAYMPIYEYWDEMSLERGEQLKLKRLVCLIFQGEQDLKKLNKIMTVNGAGEYTCLYREIKSELNLYNRPYSFYMHREQDVNGISDMEYNEWEYYTFDFFKDFSAERFLEAIIDLALDGRLIARDPDKPGTVLTKQEILAQIRHEQNNKIRYEELNSVVFNEDWFFNPDSLYILKKVNSITIYRHDYQFDDYTGDFLRVIKTPLLIISLK